MKEKLNDRPLRDVTLKHLNAVSAIAKTGTITSAANVLGVTPPAVTLQLKLLERHLGLKLFERTSRGLRPTDAGQYFVGMHARVTSLLDEANEAVIEMKGTGRGRLRIGAVSAAQYFIPRVVAQFSKSHPRIEIELHISNRAQTFGEHPHVIVAARNHKFGQKRRLSLDALRDETLIMREPGSGTRMLMERTFAMAKFSPRASMEFSSTETIKQAVIAGLGIAFVSAHTVAAELAGGQLVVLPMQGFPVTRQWYVVRPAERQLTPAGQSMWRFIVADGSTFFPKLD
jgi:DNA-binding transcriptional LysR family regulator